MHCNVLAVGPHPSYIHLVHLTSFTWWMLPGLPCFLLVFCSCVLLWMQAEGSNGRGLGTRLVTIEYFLSQQSSILWPVALVCVQCLQDVVLFHWFVFNTCSVACSKLNCWLSTTKKLLPGPCAKVGCGGGGPCGTLCQNTSHTWEPSWLHRIATSFCLLQGTYYSSLLYNNHGCELPHIYTLTLIWSTYQTSGMFAVCTY